MKRIIRIVNTSLTRAEQALHILALALLFGMMLLGFLDVILRYFFNNPITGAKELQASVLLPMIVAFAFAITQFNKANTRVEIFYAKFPPAIKKVADFIALLPPLIIWVLIVWQSIVAGNHYLKTGRIVNMVHVPLGYIQYAAALGATLLCLELLRQMVQLFTGQKTDDDSREELIFDELTDNLEQIKSEGQVET